MKFLSDLDEIIRRAINETLDDDERSRQKKQEKTVKKLDLKAETDDTKSVEEAEEEEEEAVEVEVEEEPKLKGDTKKQKSDSDDTLKDEGEDETPGTATSKKLKDPSKKEIRSPSFKSIAKNINLLRGGKSIKDPDVRKNLKAYIEKLSAEDKREVLVYLNSLAQVMSGVKTGHEAENPDEAEASKIDKVVVKKDDEIDKKSSVIVVGA
jgi:hypothetical protein